MPHPFCVLDVFAESPYTGNPLAVVRPTVPLDTSAMQRIAREMNYSETTFLLSDTPDPTTHAWPVRIFTPLAEVPFAGHPTLGTAWAIARRLLVGDPDGGDPGESGDNAPPAAIPPDQVTLLLPAGPATVTFERGPDGSELLWLRPPLAPQFGYALEPDTIAPMLNLLPSDIDPALPIQPVSCGVNFILVPVRTLAATESARFRPELRPAHSIHVPVAFLLFCPETLSPEHNFHARMFGHDYGVPEDPATGSAAVCLASYLSKQHWMGSPRIEARVEQGCEIHRPSVLHLRATSPLDLAVGGHVLLTMRGELA